MSAAWADITSVAVERVRLRRVSATFGFADVRLPGVHLCDLRVERGRDGSLTLKAPERLDAKGRAWPAYALQPDCRASIEAAISALWARS